MAVGVSQAALTIGPVMPGAAKPNAREKAWMSEGRNPSTSMNTTVWPAPVRPAL
jgi:hypothetical protein